MSAPTPRTWVLLIALAAPALGEASWRADEVWRAGGGVAALLLALAVLALAVPLLLLELGLGRATGRDLPGAVTALGGPAALGWLPVGTGLLLALGIGARAAGALGDAGAAPTGVLAAAAFWGLVGLIAATWEDPRWGAALRGRALAAGLVLGALLAAWVALDTRAALGDGLVMLLTPRPAALLRPGAWAAALGGALLVLPVGTGALTRLGAGLPERGRPGPGALQGALLAVALCAGLGALAAALGVAGGEPPQALPGHQGLRGAALLGALAALVPTAVGVTTFSTAICRALGGTPRRVAAGVAAGGAALSLALWSPAGAAALGIGLAWLVAVALPLSAAALLWAARPGWTLAARAMDREGGPRLAEPLQVGLRVALPALLGLAVLGVAAVLQTGMPGAELGALNVLTPALLGLALIVICTSLSWLGAEEQP